ncbi:hypothetical protein A3B02_02715 [Candidatus Roizmanbacteria bacterium RIFCSPLOWO2_01_FULL_42_14]|nr:MAG: hypothetical protein A3D08_01685 [Candidatus Roizmanbacteria bacterium RIFCSPHIGHO2_02_FULL_43_11]OGK52683.1 MAG: hypothetical protein A3B02_02715 [Candidatus Roizmanbacteria bacterium RIFCSPLOWO2_01_FULL_42_14]
MNETPAHAYETPRTSRGRSLTPDEQEALMGSREKVWEQLRKFARHPMRLVAIGGAVLWFMKEAARTGPDPAHAQTPPRDKTTLSMPILARDFDIRRIPPPIPFPPIEPSEPPPLITPPPPPSVPPPTVPPPPSIEPPTATPETGEKVSIRAGVPLYINIQPAPNVSNERSLEPYDGKNPQALYAKDGTTLIALVFVEADRVVSVPVGYLRAAHIPIPENIPEYTANFLPETRWVIGPDDRPLQIKGNQPQSGPEADRKRASQSTEGTQISHPDNMAASDLAPRPAHLYAPWFSARAHLPKLREKYGKDLPPEIAERLRQEGVDLETDTVTADAGVMLFFDRQGEVQVGNLKDGGSVLIKKTFRDINASTIQWALGLSHSARNFEDPSTDTVGEGFKVSIDTSTGKANIDPYWQRSTIDWGYLPTIPLPFSVKTDGQQTFYVRVDASGFTFYTIDQEGTRQEFVYRHMMSISALNRVNTGYFTTGGPTTDNYAIVYPTGVEVIGNSEQLAQVNNPGAEGEEVRGMIGLHAPVDLSRITSGRVVMRLPSQGFGEVYPESAQWAGVLDLTRSALTDIPTWISMSDNLDAASLDIMYGAVMVGTDFDYLFRFDGSPVDKNGLANQMQMQAAGYRYNPEKRLLKGAYFNETGNLHPDAVRLFSGNSAKLIAEIAQHYRGIPQIIQLPYAIALGENAQLEPTGPTPRPTGPTPEMNRFLLNLKAMQDAGVVIQEILVDASVSSQTLDRIASYARSAGIEPQTVGQSSTTTTEAEVVFDRAAAGSSIILLDYLWPDVPKSAEEAPFKRQRRQVDDPIYPDPRFEELIRSRITAFSTTP